MSNYPEGSNGENPTEMSYEEADAAHELHLDEIEFYASNVLDDVPGNDIDTFMTALTKEVADRKAQESSAKLTESLHGFGKALNAMTSDQREAVAKALGGSNV